MDFEKEKDKLQTQTHREIVTQWQNTLRRKCGFDAAVQLGRLLVTNQLQTDLQNFYLLAMLI